MTNGDDALAAGMDIVDPATGLVKDGASEINKTRDYIAQRTALVTPIEKGGTNATTPAAARTNLGINWANLDGKPTSFPPSAHTHDTSQVTSGGNNLSQRIWIHTGDTTLRSAGDTAQLWLSGSGTVYTNQPFLLPSASAATSSYTAAYINGDGRVSRGASSRKYKKYISPASRLPGILAPVLQQFQMRGGDGRWILGHIAEDWTDNPALERFVVYRDGEPDAIDYTQYLLAAVAEIAALLGGGDGANG